MATGTQKGTDITIVGCAPDYVTILKRVQGFGFDPSWDTEEHGQYGDRTPLEINKTYNGVSGSMDLETTVSPNDPDPHDMVLCILTNQNPDTTVATVTGFDPADYEKIDFIVNVWDGDPVDTSNLIKSSYLVKGGEVSGAPFDSSLDAVSTLTIDYDATTGIHFRGALTMAVRTIAAPLSANAVIGWKSAGADGLMSQILNPKVLGTTAGYINQLEPLTAGGKSALHSTLKQYKSKYHVYAGYTRTGVWKELKLATSTADSFTPGEALQAGDKLRVTVLYEDGAAIT